MSVSLKSNQALQASTLVGRFVYVPSGYMEFTNNDAVNMLLSLEEDSPKVVLYLENTAGEVVFCKNLGSLEEGEFAMEFDPLDGHEVNLSNGTYLLRAEAEINLQMRLVETYIKALVESVKLSDNQQEPILNLKNKKTIGLSKVRIIL